MSRNFWLTQIASIAIIYHRINQNAQFQTNCVSQRQDISQKPNFGPKLGLYGPNLGQLGLNFPKYEVFGHFLEFES